MEVGDTVKLINVYGNNSIKPFLGMKSIVINNNHVSFVIVSFMYKENNEEFGLYEERLIHYKMVLTERTK